MPHESVSYEKWLERIEHKMDTNHDHVMTRFDSIEDKVEAQGNRVTSLEVQVQTRPIAAGMLGVIAAIVAAIYNAFTGHNTFTGHGSGN